MVLSMFAIGLDWFDGQNLLRKVRPKILVKCEMPKILPFGFGGNAVIRSNLNKGNSISYDFSISRIVFHLALEKLAGGVMFLKK